MINIPGWADDPQAVFEFAKGVDVVTFDHEHVPPSILRELQASGLAVRPGPDALIHAQDKIAMRRALTDAGLPCPSWAQLQRMRRSNKCAKPSPRSQRRFTVMIVRRLPAEVTTARGVWLVDTL